MQINFNGVLCDTNENVLNVHNRVFRYGDSLFETLAYRNGEALFLEDHFERLCKGMNYLKMEMPKAFSVDFLQKQFELLAGTNKIEKAARIRLTVFRDGGGNYLPEMDSVSYTVSLHSLNSDFYEWSETGKSICLFEQERKVRTPLSNFKTGSALIYVLAALHAQQMKADDCLILNDAMQICDSIHSNVFLVKGTKLITPPISDGCVDGVMRKQILRMALMNKITCSMKSVTIQDLMTADEVFLTNTIKGIQWVEFFNDRQYTNHFAHYLNEILKAEVL